MSPVSRVVLQRIEDSQPQDERSRPWCTTTQRRSTNIFFFFQLVCVQASLQACLLLTVDMQHYQQVL